MFPLQNVQEMQMPPRYSYRVLTELQSLMRVAGWTGVEVNW